MKWLKNKNDTAGNGYWDTISDIMSTLLLVLLLVIMLLILYVVRAPDYNNPESNPESEITVEDGTDEQYVERDAGTAVVKTDVPYLFSDDLEAEYGQGEQTGDYEYEDGGFEEGAFDGHAGAAVRVIVEDAETHQPILEKGITFSLYSSEGRRTRLYSYYPTRTAWTQFSTDETGSFYMPQKLVLASYILHELSVPAGYEAAEDVTFTLEEPKTWDDPYTLHISLNSVRNTIHITASDSVTGDPVGGSVVDIVAAEDIRTKDGTVRFAAGTVVDQVLCDEEGEGRSTELYMGSYAVQQSAAPDYYAVGQESYPVVLTAEESEPAEQTILCDRTRFTLTVVDELYQSTAIAGAEFVMKDEAGTQSLLTTDEDGRICLDTLHKEMTYVLTQSGTLKGYQITDRTIAFYVDEYGRIADASSAEEEVTNRTLRLSVLVQDALFGNSASGCRVELYNESSQLVNSWYSTDVSTLTQGMAAGNYHLEISGAGSATVSIEIADTAPVQNITCSVWTTGNKLMIGGSAIGLAGIGTAVVLIIRRRRKKGNRAAK